MEKQGFLEKLYNGVFDEKLFFSCHGPGISDRAKKILDEYLALFDKYSPVELEEQGEIPRELWQGLKSSGMFALTIPEEYGGTGLNLSDYLGIIEGAAAKDMGLAIIPLAHHSIGLKGVLLFGSEEQKKKYLPSASSGDMIFAYVLTEPKTGSDAQNIETHAEISNDGKYYILNGTKTYITNGGHSGGMTVFAQMDKEKPGYMGAFIVETGWDGVEVGKEMPKMGLTLSSTTPIKFNNVKVPVENLIGEPGDGFKIAMTVLNYGRLGLAAASTGLMRQSGIEMLARAKKRKQFGVSISDFELIQEKIVNAMVKAFLAKAVTSFTTGILQEDPMTRVAIETSHAKLFGTTQTWDVLYDALQTHGGSGYLKTLPYEKRLRDFRVTTVFEGTTEIHSIYPPLFLIRNMTKGSKSSGGGIMSLLRAALKLLKRPSFKHSLYDPVLERAIRAALKRVKRLRFMIISGLVRYGRNITGQEFLLRRITSLSVEILSLLSSAAFIRKADDEGIDINEYKLYLEYYLADLKSSGAKNTRIKPDLKEKIHHRIFNRIIGT